MAEVLDLAATTGCPLTIVHMSLARSLELLNARPAATDGQLIGEVCLHHLFADAGLYEGGHEAALGGDLFPSPANRRQRSQTAGRAWSPATSISCPPTTASFP